jgi:hypothetical protein
VHNPSSRRAPTPRPRGARDATSAPSRAPSRSVPVHHATGRADRRDRSRANHRASRPLCARATHYCNGRTRTTPVENDAPAGRAPPLLVGQGSLQLRQTPAGGRRQESISLRSASTSRPHLGRSSSHAVAAAFHARRYPRCASWHWTARCSLRRPRD